MLVQRIKLLLMLNNITLLSLLCHLVRSFPWETTDGSRKDDISRWLS